MVSLSSLIEKDIINISTGQNIGRADDLEFNEKTAVIENIIIYGRPKFFGLFGREKSVNIPWKDILTIGRDVILINNTKNIDSGKIPENRIEFD